MHIVNLVSFLMMSMLSDSSAADGGHIQFSVNAEALQQNLQVSRDGSTVVKVETWKFLDKTNNWNDTKKIGAVLYEIYEEGYFSSGWNNKRAGEIVIKESDKTGGGVHVDLISEVWNATPNNIFCGGSSVDEKGVLKEDSGICQGGKPADSKKDERKLGDSVKPYLEKVVEVFKNAYPEMVKVNEGFEIKCDWHLKEGDQQKVKFQIDSQKWETLKTPSNFPLVNSSTCKAMLKGAKDEL